MSTFPTSNLCKQTFWLTCRQKARKAVSHHVRYVAVVRAAREHADGRSCLRRQKSRPAPRQLSLNAVIGAFVGTLEPAYDDAAG